MGAGRRNRPDQRPKFSNQRQDGARRRELSQMVASSKNGTNKKSYGEIKIVKSINLTATIKTKHGINILSIYRAVPPACVCNVSNRGTRNCLGKTSRGR